MQCSSSWLPSMNDTARSCFCTPIMQRGPQRLLSVGQPHPHPHLPLRSSSVRTWLRADPHGLACITGGISATPFHARTWPTGARAAPVPDLHCIWHTADTRGDAFDDDDATQVRRVQSTVTLHWFLRGRGLAGLGLGEGFLQRADDLVNVTPFFVDYGDAHVAVEMQDEHWKCLVIECTNPIRKYFSIW